MFTAVFIILVDQNTMWKASTNTSYSKIICANGWLSLLTDPHRINKPRKSVCVTLLHRAHGFYGGFYSTLTPISRQTTICGSSSAVLDRAAHEYGAKFAGKICCNGGYVGIIFWWINTSKYFPHPLYFFRSEFSKKLVRTTTATFACLHLNSHLLVWRTTQIQNAIIDHY